MIDITDFEISHFPDGHKHVKSNKDLKGEDTLSVSIRSFDDLFLVAQIRRIHPELTRLYVKYMLAARCDRRFSPGEAVDLEIVCDFINSLGFENVSVLKPHSPKTLSSLKGHVWQDDPTDQLVTKCLKYTKKTSKDVVFIAPDKNAASWVCKKIDSHFGNFNNVITCEKKRSGDSIEVTFNSELAEGDDTFVIVDDLCDGGKTFTEIAKAIKLQKPSAKVYLCITHGIFSKGFDVFKGLIDGIYCTDSYAKFENHLLTQIPA